MVVKWHHKMGDPSAELLPVVLFLNFSSLYYITNGNQFAKSDPA